MKKALLFFALILATATGLYAQKQTGGEKNLEVQFAPLGGNPISISGIRLRIFNSESSAIRIGLFLGGTSTTDVTAQPEEADPDAPELLDVTKTFSFSIRPGYEIHFAGTDRLSPYVGAELLFGITSETTTEESWDLDSDLDGSIGTFETKDGTSTIGANLVAGADFYFADNIYLGAELGFGFSSTSNKDTEVTYDGPADIDNIDPFLNGKSSGWGPNYQGTIRLGWLFN